MDNHVQDPLLDCLIFIAKYYNQPYSAKALTAGLPLSENDKLNPKLFLLALEKLNLTGEIKEEALSDLSEEDVPCVLIFHHDAYVLTEISDEGKFTLYKPGQGEDTDVDVAHIHEHYAGFAVTVKPTHRFDERTEEPIKIEEKHWFWQVLMRFWLVYSEVALAAFLINMFALAAPLFVMNVYNRIIPVNAMESLWALSIGMFIIIGFDFILRSLRSRFIERAGRIIDNELSDKVFSHVLNIETNERPTAVGTLVNTIRSFDHFREFITSGSITVFIDFPFLFIFLLALYLIGGWLVVIPLVIMSFAIIVGLLVQKKIVKLINSDFRYSAEKNAILVEVLTHIENVKGMSLEGLMQKKWNLAEHSSTNHLVKLHDLVNFSNNFAAFTQQLAYVGIIIGGVYKVAAGDFTVGALIACSIIGGRVLAPVVQFCGLISKYQQSKASIVAIDKIMKMPVERSETASYIHHKKFKGHFKFEEVFFAYKNQPIDVLENINLKIMPGEKVGILGKSGSGKSTLIKLAMRFYQPTSGHILVDGTNLNQIDPVEYRSEIGYVPQQTALFYGSIKENIAMHTSIYTKVEDEMILKVVQLCNLNKIINSHPAGYSRQVGEGGQFLSSGQKQMIAIARSLVTNPDMLIWDEPTNAIDDPSAMQIMANIKEYIRDKTLILSTHKLNILFLIERLIVIDKGRIIADGPRDEVMKAIAEKRLRPHTKPGDM